MASYASLYTIPTTNQTKLMKKGMAVIKAMAKLVEDPIKPKTRAKYKAEQRVIQSKKPRENTYAQSYESKLSM